MKVVKAQRDREFRDIREFRDALSVSLISLDYLNSLKFTNRNDFSVHRVMTLPYTQKEWASANGSPHLVHRIQKP